VLTIPGIGCLSYSAAERTNEENHITSNRFNSLILAPYIDRSGGFTQWAIRCSYEPNGTYIGSSCTLVIVVDLCFNSAYRVEHGMSWIACSFSLMASSCDLCDEAIPESQKRQYRSADDQQHPTTIMKIMFNRLSLLLISLLFLFGATVISAQQTTTFRGKSKLMLEKVLEDSPFIFRKKVRSKIMNELGNGEISEKDVLDAILKTTPSIFLSRALDTAKRFQNNQPIAEV